MKRDLPDVSPFSPRWPPSQPGVESQRSHQPRNGRTLSPSLCSSYNTFYNVVIPIVQMRHPGSGELRSTRAKAKKAWNWTWLLDVSGSDVRTLHLHSGVPRKLCSIEVEVLAIVTCVDETSGAGGENVDLLLGLISVSLSSFQSSWR